MPTAKLISVTPNIEDTLMAACHQPYGNHVTPKGIQAIISSGHLSILEHCYATFEVTCSVRVLGQLTRHRHLSFTCKSARGSDFDTFVLPEGLSRVAKNRWGDYAIKEIHDAALHAYKEAKENLSLEDAAYLLPQGVETSLVVTGNFRAWYEYLPKRLCKRAMPEHRQLAELIHKQLAAAAPLIFDRNLLNCANCTERSCSFK